mmetsp:Transcript_39013/g.62308  ORF Transcript_39013/g.62308 Transcript_39013/m.62308 type:complete len:209 (-) Transcript_39013:704-1330(-)
MIHRIGTGQYRIDPLEARRTRAIITNDHLQILINGHKWVLRIAQTQCRVASFFVIRWLLGFQAKLLLHVTKHAVLVFADEIKETEELDICSNRWLIVFKEGRQNTNGMRVVSDCPRSLQLSISKKQPAQCVRHQIIEHIGFIARSVSSTGITCQSGWAFPKIRRRHIGRIVNAVVVRTRWWIVGSPNVSQADPMANFVRVGGTSFIFC